MPIQGSIAEVGLPDVLQLLSLGRKTGCLSMGDGQTHGEIYLDAGRISFASVANRLDRLGEVLVKSGRLTHDQLKVATEEQARGSKERIGKILVEAGHIGQEELDKWITLQVEESVYFLFTWKQGTFTFTSDRRPPHEPLPASLDAEGLLLEGARRVDEWSQIEKKIPSFDLVYRRGKDKLGSVATGELTYPQQRILPLLDGTRDVRALVDSTGLSEFDVGKALYGLVTAGIVQLVERRTHIRHLDYRELLAYVVREADFADPQRRKDAGRHIVDCPQCANRLRTIQVRRTEGSGVFVPATLELEPPEALQAPVARLSQQQPAKPAARSTSAAAPPRPARPERRGGDRRTGRDRRQVERRAGFDRRCTVNALWEQEHEERRLGPRRVDDWVGGRSRERRNGDAGRRAVASASPVRPAGGQRMTEPRQIRPFAARGGHPSRVAAALDDDSDLEFPQVAAEAEDDAVPEAVAGASDQAQGGARAEAAPPARRAPAQAPAESSPGDLAWLVSPQESVEMIRASRGIVAPRAADAPPPAAAPAAAARAAEAREPEATGRVTTGSNAAPGRPAVGAGSSGSLRNGFDELWGVGEGTRRVAVGAAITVLVLVAYLAGQFGGRGRGDHTVGAAPASAVAPGAETAAREPAKSRPGERRLPSQTKPVQTVAHQAPAPSRSPAAPAVRPTQPVSQPVQQRPAVTENPQRAAPTPVTAAQPSAPQAPPAAQPAPAAATPSAAKVEAPPPAAPRAAEPRSVAAAEPDRDLAAGGWAPVDRAGATATLGGTLGAIDGLFIESITQSTAGTRTRVRVAQLTQAGERIVLTETRAGAAVRGAGPAVVTALRVMPASEAYPFSTGTVSLGNILITVKSSLAADALQSLLAKLGDVAPGR